MITVVAVLTYAFRMAAHLGGFGELTNTIKDVAVAGGGLVLAGTLPFSDEQVNLLNKRESETAVNAHSQAS
jgi:hypothetical protein